jgi:hypothetical protein
LILRATFGRPRLPNARMNKASLLILGISSLFCSRAMFYFFNDPEGPNLVVVIGMAVIVYLPSLAAYSFVPSVTGLKRLLVAIAVQVMIVTGAYFLLK